MAYKINGTTVVDNSRNVCACCVTSCCITASTRMDAPSGTTAQRPSSPATGSLYFDTDEGSLLSYNGTDWAAVGGGGGVSAIELNETLSDSCDALGVLFIGTRCCVTNCGCYCSNKNLPSSCGTSVVFNHCDAHSCVKAGGVSGSGKTYISYTPFYGQAPCHNAQMQSKTDRLVTNHVACLTCGGFNSCPNHLNCFMMNTVNGCGWNCLGKHCGTPVSPSIHLYGGYGGASFSDLTVDTDSRLCSASTTCKYGNNEHFINTKGGFSVKTVSGTFPSIQICTGKCIGLDEYSGAAYYHDGPWGPVPTVIGALRCYNIGSCMCMAMFTVKESAFGNSGLEVCDFAFEVQGNSELGCCSFTCNKECYSMSMPWVIPNILQGCGSSRCLKMRLSPTFPDSSCFCYPFHKFSLISKRIGYNTFEPDTYCCCVANSQDSNGVTSYATNKNATGAWLFAVKINPHCGGNCSPYCYGSCRLTPVMSKDKCCIDFLLSIFTPNCCCFCCIGGYQYTCNTNTNCCCRNDCFAIEVHTLNLVTGNLCHCGIMTGKCNYWIHELENCCNSYTEACIRKFGQNPTEHLVCANSCCSIPNTLPEAFGTKLTDSKGFWSCNHCKMYFTHSQGVTVYDGCKKAYVCHICDFSLVFKCFLSNSIVKKLYKCCCWYANGSCDSCFSCLWSKCCLLSHYCGCLCSPFQTMGLSNCGAWNFCCDMYFCHPTMKDGYQYGCNEFNSHSQYLYVNPYTDHLVYLGRMFTCVACCKYISWEGIVCYDLENKCLSKVHTIFPDLKSRINTYGSSGNQDNKQVGVETGLSNPYSCNCICAGSAYAGRLYMNADCSSAGFQLVHYSGKCQGRVSDQYYGNGIVFSKTGDCCGSVFGCSCLGACLKCCSGRWYAAAAFFRVPHDKPWECAGLENDCDMLKLFGGAFQQGDWHCALFTCCTCFCVCCSYKHRCYLWSGAHGGFTGVTGCTTGYRWTACNSIKVHDADTLVVCACCVGGTAYSYCGKICDMCFGCCRWWESCMYKGIKNSSFPNSNPMDAVLDANANWCATPCDIKDVGNICDGPVTFGMNPACGDTSITNRICRFFKEKVVCMC
jgi:hypothetical protein